MRGTAARTVAAYTWRAQQAEDVDRAVELEILRTAARLVLNHAVLARLGDGEAVAWLESERFERCCRALRRDPDELRRELLEDEEGPDAPAGALLRDRAAMARLTGSGMTVRQIAAHLCLPVSTVGKWIKRHGLVTSAKRARRPAKKGAAHAA